MVHKDSWRNPDFLDWINEKKEASSEANDLYNDLLVQRHESLKKAGGSKFGLSSFTNQFALKDTDSAMDNLIEKKEKESDEILHKLVDKYGKEYLESLSPKELYQEYKQFSKSV